jgi:hypothetical protein
MQKSFRWSHAERILGEGETKTRVNNFIFLHPAKSSWISAIACSGWMRLHKVKITTVFLSQRKDTQLQLLVDLQPRLNNQF